MQHGIDAGDQENFWAGAQNFLNATANISKSCWGQGGRLAQERRSLRESLHIADNSPLSNTDLRNHMDHYDERLDRWYKESQNKNYADFIIGPVNSIAGLTPTDMFRHYDPSTGHIIFWGEHYSVPTLIKAVQTLLPIAVLESQKPHWKE
ncbi:MAG TPA: hypothetical protein VMB52_00175 [Verrucomicrobiae bacterium]|nr:hypothetical protein [Verrucomicrobiae bacterium]